MKLFAAEGIPNTGVFHVASVLGAFPFPDSSKFLLEFRENGEYVGDLGLELLISLDPLDPVRCG